MFYLGIIAVLLGIISVFLTINYMKHTDSINIELKNIRNKCIQIKKMDNVDSKIIELFFSLKKKYNISYDDIYNIVVTHYKKSKSNNISEKFSNFKPNKFLYTNMKKRGLILNKKKYQNKNIDLVKIKNILESNNIKELSKILGNYRELFNRTFERIQTITEDGSLDKHFHKKVNFSEKNKKLKCSKKKKINFSLEKLKFCQQDNLGKKYCFRISDNMSCPNGKIVESIKNCDYY